MTDDYTPPVGIIPDKQNYNSIAEATIETASEQTLPAVAEDQKTDVEVFSETVDAYLEKDFDLVRNNLRSLLTNSTEAMTQLASIARASDHPRAYEVLANLMKTIQEINKDLLDLHKKKRDLSGPTQAQQADTINNNQYIFNGTPAELLALRKKQQKEEIDE